MSVPHEPAGVPALNLRAQYQTIRDEIEPVVRQVLETQGFVMGPEVSGLESEIGEYVGAAHAVGCASGLRRRITRRSAATTKKPAAMTTRSALFERIGGIAPIDPIELWGMLPGG